MISKNETYLCCFGFSSKKWLHFNCSQKNHTQPCFDMQLIELMPFFSKAIPKVSFCLFFKGYSHWSHDCLPFSQRLVAWVCLTSFSEAPFSKVFQFLFFQRLLWQLHLPFFHRLRPLSPHILRSGLGLPPPNLYSAFGHHIPWPSNVSHPRSQ